MINFLKLSTNLLVFVKSSMDNFHGEIILKCRSLVEVVNMFLNFLHVLQESMVMKVVHSYSVVCVKCISHGHLKLTDINHRKL